jgi:hypothetical protein
MIAATSLAPILSELEDELFYAVLDVALDIRQALTLQTTKSPIYIPFESSSRPTRPTDGAP